MNTDDIVSRQMQDGHWYWTDKAIIRQYARRVGAVAIAVYDCLASFANRDQTCYPSQQYIADILGCSRTTVNRAIRNLKLHGLIAIEKHPIYPQVYRLLHVSRDSGAPELSSTCTLPVSPAHTNKNKQSRNNNNNGGTAGLIRNLDLDHSDGFHLAIENEPLALQIAEALDDRKNLHAYLAYCRTYSKPLLQYALREASAVPEHKIKKSRAALFKHLVKIYAEQTNHHPGH